MITAKEAKDISDNLQTQRSRECLVVIDKLIKAAAAKGDTKVDIKDISPSSAVLLYLESLGYSINTVKIDRHDSILVREIVW